MKQEKVELSPQAVKTIKKFQGTTAAELRLIAEVVEQAKAKTLKSCETLIDEKDDEQK